MSKFAWWPLFLLLSIPSRGLGQEWAGLQVHSGQGYNQGENIVITENDEKYVVGTYQYNWAHEEPVRMGCQIMPESQVTPFLTLISLGVVMKYSAIDEIQWVRSVPMRAQDIAVNANGDYFVLGKIDYDIFINGETYHTRGNQGLLMAYTHDGQYKWHKIVRPGSPTFSSSSTALFHSLDIQSNGSVIVSGRSNISGTLLPDNYPIPSGGFLFRFDGETGEMLNHYDMIGIAAEVFKVHVDAFDNIFIGGKFDTFTFASITYFAGNNHDAFLAKFDSDFNEEWSAIFKSSNNGFIGFPRSITSDINYIYFSGTHRNSIDLNGTHAIGESIGDIDSYVGCIDMFGDIQWTRRIEGLGFKIVSDITVGKNEVFITGTFSQNIAGLSQFQADGYRDVFVIALNKNGTLRWGLQGGSKNEPVHDAFPNSEAANAIAVDSKQNVYIVGNTWRSGNYGSYHFHTEQFTDFFVAKIANAASETVQMPPLNCPPIWPEIQIYPNPSVDKIFVSTTGQTIEVQIINSIGQTLRKFQPVQDDDPLQIDISDLSSGVYIINLRTNHGEVSEKFIKISQ